MRRLRVLRISHSATLSLYRERERTLSSHCNLDVALIFPETWPHLGGTNESDKLSEPFYCRSVRTIGTGSVPLFAFDPFPIISVMKSFQPHVIDIHEEPYSISCVQSLALAKTFAPQAACVFYSAQNINKKYPPPFRWTERYVYLNSRGAYPCSESVRDVLLQKGFSKPCPVIPLGVDTVRFSLDAQPLAFGFENDQLVIGYTGRLESCKGIEYLLQAVALLGELKQRVSVLIAGTGSDEASIRTLCADLGIASKVKFLGELPAEQMPGFYTACNVIVIPSVTTATWREQFGRVAIEAMACGVPVIATDSGSLPEVANDAAVLVPERDHGAIATALNDLLSNPIKRSALIAKGRKRAEQKYSWNSVADAMTELYSVASLIEPNCMVSGGSSSR